MSSNPQHVTTAPSLLTADSGLPGEEMAVTGAVGADWLNPGTIDGHFVPHLNIRHLPAFWPRNSLPFDVELMISPVDQYQDACFPEAANPGSVNPADPAAPTPQSDNFPGVPA